MAHGDTREGKWRRNWGMEWVASTFHTTSEHGVSSITTADAHTSPASSRLNWRPRRLKWIRPFRWKTKSGFCAFKRSLQQITLEKSDAFVISDCWFMQVTPTNVKHIRIEHETDYILGNSWGHICIFCTGLFKMIVWVLTTCHTQYTSDSSLCIFLFNRTTLQFLLHTLQVLCMCGIAAGQL
jgi:hypothetical protein